MNAGPGSDPFSVADGDVARIEQDSLGELAVPEGAYFGIHTVRACVNFPISGDTLSRHAELIRGLMAVKQAAALANRDLGRLDGPKSGAIVAACEEVRRGCLHDQFPIDPIQGGAGTSTNMNVNEVIANRALEILGLPRGDYRHVHPIDDVNLNQSTNDVYPTAAKLALLEGASGLVAALRELEHALRHKATDFADYVKVGRTQLQDAVPMTLGQEFGAFASTVARDIETLTQATAECFETNLGGTAIGTGIAGHPEFAELAISHLRDITGHPMQLAADPVSATQDVGALVQVSGALRRIAVRLSKICNDLRMLSSGPRAGLGEIFLPPVQAGSSIMPGKVNPVIPEVVNQIAFDVVGRDLTVSMAAEAGQLQLNAFLPLMTHNVLVSLRHLARGAEVLAHRCVVGISADRELLRAQAESSIGLATALNERVGYAIATKIAQRSMQSGLSVREVAIESCLVDPEELDELLSLEVLAGQRERNRRHSPEPATSTASEGLHS